MLEHIETYLQEIKQFQSSNKDEIEQFRIKFNGKKGILNAIFDEFKQVPNEQKKAFGQKINVLKQAVAEKLEELKNATTSNIIVEKEDLTRPGYPLELGSRHPINLVKNRIIEIFKSIGFAVSDGPEIEDDWHNFTALNLPEYHPARDMQDTFFIEQNPDILLRTHTSSVQIRHMEQNEPPIRILSPGRVFRNEAISSRSHCIFHQIEGLYIDEKVSFADLKQTIQFFTTELFGKSKIRMRPSYFPFTEPSAEVDVYWGLNSEIDYRITKGTGWLEIMGCGMVDPAVLKNVNIDPDKYSGYAFGMGIERIVMLLYQMSDIRMFFENDVRMFEQFKTL
ncbi:phenylalanine--tRNA ligase subunit alpha [Riemerella anatipestifer]|uniref:Phenylalanine--tRNA ligase alpha subunit n=1 Tax=Riemerella anatipestifer TaxID=34085 RepID=A0AAP6LMS6_RIEAN|nr:phenylalanine--tRNA ligase subunit alpha [Riemerella anatipestifer]MCD5968332.1 phenylalanine--tRNA ligase subunit alpha [Riemerella anatipestifer]MCO7355693.1 phenylalanine--tRNA ligase subunit alpha [Riemerella anatipestifer]MCU7541298.1 phenylalanine--tRNA ligase subunit alpha [Riemerella anatipestifer]MCU7571380.1 phenylalanine--tRNA ligase subunit alpha [Riemerella anatipestifer]MCU7598107.1 phenylalanine--tRNA ligase subunit alpha [Riemerella anatipestifer]